MTLKQFFQVAGGAVIALLIYSTNLPGYVKWPLIILSFLTGVALAFFPIEDRPLEVWIIAFFKSIYSPTLFVWKKTDKKKAYFQPETGPDIVNLPTKSPQKDSTFAKVQAQVQKEPPGDAKKEVEIPVAQSPAVGELEKKEQEFLQEVEKHFDSTTDLPAVSNSSPPQSQKTAQPPQADEDKKEPDFRKTKDENVFIPDQQAVKVKKTKPDKPQTVAPRKVDETTDVNYVSPSTAKKINQKAQEATYSQSASPPTPPEKPNTVTGQVLDNQGNIVENAILEIKDEDGRSVRALKTNSLGHFAIVTPLTNGKYQIVTQKHGLDFDNTAFEAKGEIIPSIQIKAKQSEIQKAQKPEEKSTSTDVYINDNKK